MYDGPALPPDQVVKISAGGAESVQIRVVDDRLTDSEGDVEVLPGERTIGVTYEPRVLSVLSGTHIWLSLCFITFVAELGHFYVADAATDSHDTWTKADDTWSCWVQDRWSGVRSAGTFARPPTWKLPLKRWPYRRDTPQG